MQVRLGQRTSAFPVVTQRSGFIFPAMPSGAERWKQLGEPEPGARRRFAVLAIGVKHHVAVTWGDPVVPRHCEVRTQPVDGVEREAPCRRATRIGKIITAAVLESLSHAIHI